VTDQTASRRTPTAEEWEGSCQAGEMAVKAAIADAALQRIRVDSSGYGDVGVALGALVAIGALLRGIGEGGSQHVMENMAMAYLRGALRGTEGPVNADGSDYVGTHDA
jgi:hypothetical protein